MSERWAPVSVVIPFYGGNDTIQRAIRSVNEQSLRPREILVVDDGSPDPVDPAQLESEVEVRILTHADNRGIPAARNTAIRAARTHWIALLDQDDEWTRDKLERQWEGVRKAGEDSETIVFGRLLLPGEDGAPPWAYPANRSIRRMEQGGRAALRELVLHGCVTPPVTLLFNRKLLERYGYLDEDLRGGADDYELVLRMAASGARFIFNAPLSTARYSSIRHHTGRNYSAHAPRYLRDDLRIIRKLAAELPLMSHYREKALARVWYAFGRHYDRSRTPLKASACYRRASRLDRCWWKPWLARLRLVLPARAQRWIEAGWEWLERARRGSREHG